MDNPLYQSRLETLPMQSAGGLELIPVVRRRMVSLPCLPAGWVWLTPAGVDVRYADGHLEWVPIRDWTRFWRVAILLAPLALVWMLLRNSGGRRRARETAN